MSNLLIIVDMLNDFAHPNGVLFHEGAKEITPIISNMIGSIESEFKNFIYICDGHDEDDLEFQKFPPHAIKGTWGSEIVDELKPLNFNIPYYFISKNRYSGFFGTPLESILKEINPSVVTVVGVCTSICVMDTVGGLANRDYNVVVPSSAVSDFDPEMHEMSLKRMKNIYGAKIE